MSGPVQQSREQSLISEPGTASQPTPKPLTWVLGPWEGESAGTLQHGAALANAQGYE